MEMKRGNFPVAVDTIMNILDSDTPLPPLETVLLHHFPPLPPPQTERTPPVLYQQPIDRKDTHETPAHRDPIHIPPAFHQQPYPPQHPLQPSFDRQGTPETDANRLPPIPVQQRARQSDSQLNPYALQLFNMIASQLMTQQPMFSNHRHQQPSPIPRTLFQPC